MKDSKNEYDSYHCTRALVFQLKIDYFLFMLQRHAYSNIKTTDMPYYKKGLQLKLNLKFLSRSNCFITVVICQNKCLFLQ